MRDIFFLLTISGTIWEKNSQLITKVREKPYFQMRVLVGMIEFLYVIDQKVNFVEFLGMVTGI